MTIPDFEKITAFWCEVVNTIEHLLDETDEFNAREVMTHYEDSLRMIDQNLTFHFERDEKDERIEMVFGCDGYAQSIASVLSLVDAAPTIDGVQVIAFNHRHDPLPTSIRIGEDEFELDDFWYSFRIESGEFHLSVFVKNLDDQDQNPAVEAVMVFLDALLGEFDLMTRVATLNWYPQPSVPEDHGLRPLVELRDQFDQSRADISLIGVTLH
ncbi:hypothetical protein [Motiliproteus sp. MSK22-1]|uniref:hypothetical protein n=1 Tax=Motiliproteus sp. MSK22-1 TaxID=1897630 RepID=UPI001E4381D2|nr:hypothetical protein [Motiliproteus sp. MSK22-1]